MWYPTRQLLGGARVKIGNYRKGWKGCIKIAIGKAALKRPPLDKRLTKIFQRLAWKIFNHKRWDQGAKDVSVQGTQSLNVTKVNEEK